MTGSQQPAATPGPNAYTALASGQDLRHELVVKRSRFITVLGRVGDEAAARTLIAELRREFHDARHHCSAFVIGAGREVQRCNDDGEPSGTAGLPMLETVLKRETPDSSPGTTPVADLSDMCAVVVRYFGGTLLGAGGLVRAYSEAVSGALDRARLVRRSRLALCTVAIPHAAAGRLENDLRNAGYLMSGNSYTATETLVGLALSDDAEVIAAACGTLASLTAGRGILVRTGTDWVDTPLPG